MKDRCVGNYRFHAGKTFEVLRVFHGWIRTATTREFIKER